MKHLIVAAALLLSACGSAGPSRPTHDPTNNEVGYAPIEATQGVYSDGHNLIYFTYYPQSYEFSMVFGEELVLEGVLIATHEALPPVLSFNGYIGVGAEWQPMHFAYNPLKGDLVIISPRDSSTITLQRVRPLAPADVMYVRNRVGPRLFV